MTAHSTAQGIASLGRYGDDLIVHMNQEEVQGLQALAKKHGTSLTINPKTGMPEAFKLGGVFKALIPIAAGVMFPGFGASIFGGMQGIGAGILAGAATAALTGGNPIMGGITGALGGYSGAGLGNSFANLGSAGAATGTNVANLTAQNAATNVVGNTLMGQGATAFTSPFISPFTPAGIAGGAGLGAGTVANAGIVGQGALSNVAGNALTNQAMNASLTGANTVANAGNAINLAGTTQAATPTYGDKLKSGVEKFFSKETSYVDPISGKTVTGSGLDAYKASLPTKGGEITGVTKDAAGNVIGSTETPRKLASNMDVFKKIGTPIGGALLGGVEESDLNPQVNLSDQEQKVYEQVGVDAAGKPTFGYIAKSAFNPYRTLNLSGPSSLNLGASLKLPAPTGYAAGGIVQPTIQSGGVRDLYGLSDNQTQPLSSDGFGLGRLSSLANQQAMTTAKTLGYADGGDVGGDVVDESAPNPEGIVSKYTTVVDDKGIASRARVPFQYEKIITPGALDFYDIPPIGYNPDTYAGLLRKQRGMARGGYLDGAGDGMSDSIPATIEGKQPARLADGEFVVPADVVSHLGNGSSKAGSKRLYAMLDKVRRARTGRVKQGKQINADRYLPRVA